MGGIRFTGSVALAALLVICAGVVPARSMTMAPQNVAGLASAAQDIVVGTVSKVTEGRQGGLAYTQVTIDVSDTLLGTPARTITFKQIGGLAPQAPVSGRRFIGRIEGMPRYAAGENVILFLGRTSSLGFRSPIGLQQGKFTVLAGNALNEAGNLGLFKGVTTKGASLTATQQAMLATRQGGVHAAAFIDFVRQGVQKHWWSR
ncbi:MAG TPA: hypothetical protein VJV75_05975 [Candidatus Polarisedimenticolia bacterium]|nr:hypothetical protein [Candidatus Polarisedimenticolia bacterium]